MSSGKPLETAECIQTEYGAWIWCDYEYMCGYLRWTAPDTIYSRNILEWGFYCTFSMFWLDVIYQISLLKWGFLGCVWKRVSEMLSPFHLVNNSTCIFSVFPSFLCNVHSFHESPPMTSYTTGIYLWMIKQCQHCLGVCEDSVRVYQSLKAAWANYNQL